MLESGDNGNKMGGAKRLYALTYVRVFRVPVQTLCILRVLKPQNPILHVESTIFPEESAVISFLCSRLTMV